MGIIKIKYISLIFGKFLIIVGAIIGIQPLAVFISVPLYTIGQIITWNSTIISQKSKLIWTIAPLLGILIVWILLMIYIMLKE
jgi:hypothetical protein